MNARVTVMALALLTAASIPPTAPARAQALKDPGFERPAPGGGGDVPGGRAQISGTVADGWQDNTGWADVKIVYSLDRNDPHGGGSSQKIEIQRGFAQFVQPVLFRAGGCRAGLWLRARPAQWVTLTLRLAGAPYTAYAARPLKVGARWTRASVEGLTPAVAGGLYVNLSGPGSVWLDDASLTAAAPPALSPPPGPIPRAFFGLNVNHMHDRPGFAWPALDFGTYRTWDSGVIWPEIETARGVYDWAELDRDVGEAQTHHTQVLFTLGQTPTWASSRPDEAAVYGKGFAAPPTDIRDWRDFVRAVATRYRGRIRAYEVWNEPDQREFYTGTPAQLVALERATAEVVHGADPAALVLSPAVAGGDGVAQLTFLDDYLAAGGGRSADVLAYHGYNDPAENDIEAVRSFRSLVRAHGLAGKPIWDTETGTDLSTTSEADTAAFVARDLVLGWALGLRRVFLYAYDGSFTGLDAPTADPRRRDPGRLGPSGVAYAQVESWMTGARMLSCASDGRGTWTCALQRAGGARAWIVWNTMGTRSLAVPAAWRIARLRTLAGVSEAVGTGSVTVGDTPLLLERHTP